MSSIRILVPALLSLAITSCASRKADPYDTADPYGVADAGMVNEPANPVYDTPAAYEETGTTAPYPQASADPNIYGAATPAVPAAPSNGRATIHTVVAGDTLSGLSAKYNVPVAEIKQANSMTSDIVVLGRKMVIPPAR